MCKFERERPAQTIKAEVIRKKFCLDSYEVFEDPDDYYTFYQHANKGGKEYICFNLEELKLVKHDNEVYLIHVI